MPPLIKIPMRADFVIPATKAIGEERTSAHGQPIIKTAKPSYNHGIHSAPKNKGGTIITSTARSIINGV